MKMKLLIKIVILMTAVILAACSGPEEKKAKFYNKGKALYEKGDYVKAKLEFKNAIQIDPKYTDSHYMLGVIALKTGDPAGAYKKFSKVVELDPQHWDAQIHLGKFLLAAGEMKEAMEKADLVLKEQAGHEDALLLKTSVLLKKKDTDGAQRFLESVIGRDLRKPEGYLLLSSLYAQKGEARNVEKILLEGIQSNNKAAALYLALADFYLIGKQPERAENLMLKVIEIEPDIGKHRLALAGIYWKSGKEQQAVDTLNVFMAANPKKEERWIQAADFYNARNKPGISEQLLKEGIQKNGRSFSLRFALSAFYLSQGRPDQSVSVLLECLGLEKNPANPDIIQTKISLARFYLAKQEIEKAKKYVDEVLKESPKNIGANYLAGTIYLGKKDGVQAISSFRTVVNEKPEFIPGYIGLSEAHAINNEMNLAFDLLQKALKMQPDSRDLIRAIARLHMMKKDYAKAESSYRSILDKNPDDLEARADLGDLMLSTGGFRQAEAEYSKIKRRAPKHPMAYIRLGALYIAQQQWEKAIRELDYAVRIQPDVWVTSNDLATLLSEYGQGKNDLDRALALAEKAKSLNPDNANILDTIGWVHYRKGDVKQALDWLTKAQVKAPDNPVFNYHLGMAFHKTGNVTKAKEHLRIALSSKVNFSGKAEADKAMARIK